MSARRLARRYRHPVRSRSLSLPRRWPSCCAWTTRWTASSRAPCRAVTPRRRWPRSWCSWASSTRWDRPPTPCRVHRPGPTNPSPSAGRPREDQPAHGGLAARRHAAARGQLVAPRGRPARAAYGPSALPRPPRGRLLLRRLRPDSPSAPAGRAGPPARRVLSFAPSRPRPCGPPYENWVL